ncbi:unnamed protein product [Linum tenue]|uniref:Ubiquitin thioesterase OTU n=1 Tax=Linum tenue TaxID=586396 RepID=A0AAV0JX61_9ROSI|nr:unnamed protein product [Linum tenue]
MIVQSSMASCTKHIVRLRGRTQHMGSNVLEIVSKGQPSSCSLCFTRKRSNHQQSLTVKSWVSARSSTRRYLNISLPCQNVNMGLSMSRQGIKGNMGTLSWSQQGCTSSGCLVFGLFVCCCSNSEPTTHAQAPMEEGPCFKTTSNGRKVYTDYSITGIPGDGRCLFRSVAHGACVRAGKSPPSESLQRELADDLRDRIADEFIKRRQETEWFVEGDFDTYVKQIRKPHVWGGEPELFMASHVLKMPISVYMYDADAGGLISIAEYGQEYGKDNPIRVLYHGSGHYDALQIPGRKHGKSRL